MNWARLNSRTPKAAAGIPIPPRSAFVRSMLGSRRLCNERLLPAAPAGPVFVSQGGRTSVSPRVWVQRAEGQEACTSFLSGYEVRAASHRPGTAENGVQSTLPHPLTHWGRRFRQEIDPRSPLQLCVRAGLTTQAQPKPACPWSSENRGACQYHRGNGTRVRIDCLLAARL
jgi:hypothetical protein